MGRPNEMWLPVMDGANKTMKAEAYAYPVWDKVKRQYVEKKVDYLSCKRLFDSNKMSNIEIGSFMDDDCC